MHKGGWHFTFCFQLKLALLFSADNSCEDNFCFPCDQQNLATEVVALPELRCFIFHLNLINLFLSAPILQKR